jgi:para-aminobenzoate synthetase component 1
MRAYGRRIALDCLRDVRPDVVPGFHSEEGDSFECVRRLLQGTAGAVLDVPGEVPFVGGAVGYFGYELAEQLDRVALHGRDDLAFPDLTLLFIDRLIALDHQRGVAYAIGLGFGADPTEASRRAERAMRDYADRLSGVCSRTGVAPSEPDLARRRQLLATPQPDELDRTFDRAEYCARVRALKEEIAAGNVYEANLTQRMSLPFGGDPWELYLALRRASPAPFACYLDLPDGAILSSSPERFLRLDAGGAVESRPIKGTRPRGSSRDEDEALEKELAGSEKDRAENLMIVDLVRNDLGRVCEIGSVRVPELMSVERYASVFQLVSTVTGTLCKEHDAIDLIRASFPPGSMTGAPKLAAMEILDRLEPVRRGVYSGAIGYLDLRGGLDLSVVIRTLLVKKGQAYLHVGGAVVADSEPEAEFAESLDKSRALLAALAALDETGGRGSG